MRSTVALAATLFAAGMVRSARFARADTLELEDGTALSGCFARDEGVRFVVWEKLADVGSRNVKAIPRSQVKSWKVQRDNSWDTHPDLPDLSITFIEMNPKLAGLHGQVDYDVYSRPVLRSKALPDLGERATMHPEEVVKNLKLRYQPGEELTLTAHVRNVGFAPAQPFEYVWLVDGKEIGKGKCDKALKEMEEAALSVKWKWQDGQHSTTFRITTQQPEIATANNEAADPLWGWGFVFTVSNGRAAAWHRNRTAVGTFCFEDYYRWHVDLMNLLFANSIFPSAPEGIKARVRLDRIIYTDDIDPAVKSLVSPDGIRYDQGNWTWTDSPEETKSGQWQPPPKEWRNGTEWSLPHELGHQLGLTDWYFLDYGLGGPYHVMPDGGGKVTHFQTHGDQMMHDHGPRVYGEVDAAYLNMTWDKPRGHFGDYYFAIPRENLLRIVDVNGTGVSGAKVEIFQRGTVVDPSGPAGDDRGVKYFAVVEDGKFEEHPVSEVPVIVGATDDDGVLRLPNRPVVEVTTLNGFHREPNPFGNINVVGERGDMMIRITKNGRACYAWLEIFDFCVAWFRGQKDRYTTLIRTPYGSASSPLPPIDVAITPLDANHVKVTWKPPKVVRETQYLDRALGYRVYRRISNEGLNYRPWTAVALLGPDGGEFVVDLSQRPDDVYSIYINRFGVTSVGENYVESEIVEAPLPPPPK